MTSNLWKAMPFLPTGISIQKNLRAEVLEAAVGKGATKQRAEQGFNEA